MMRAVALVPIPATVTTAVTPAVRITAPTIDMPALPTAESQMAVAGMSRMVLVAPIPVRRTTPLASLPVRLAVIAAAAPTLQLTLATTCL